MSKYTPGPWGCFDTSNSAHDYRLTKPNGSPLPLNVESNDHSEQRANARLIASAPELLDALDRLERQSGLPLMSDDPVRIAARAAIAKAKGEK